MKLIDVTWRHIEILTALPAERLPTQQPIAGLTLIDDGGWPLACGGVLLLGKQRAEIFASFGPWAKRYPLQFSRLVKNGIRDLDKLDIKRVTAYADPRIERSERFLVFLGFKPTGRHTRRGIEYRKWL